MRRAGSDSATGSIDDDLATEPNDHKDLRTWFETKLEVLANSKLEIIVSINFQLTKTVAYRMWTPLLFVARRIIVTADHPRSAS